MGLDTRKKVTKLQRIMTDICNMNPDCDKCPLTVESGSCLGTQLDSIHTDICDICPVELYVGDKITLRNTDGEFLICKVINASYLLVDLDTGIAEVVRIDDTVEGGTDLYEYINSMFGVETINGEEY